MDVVDIKQLLKELALDYTNLELESESQEYDACRFVLGNQKVVFRSAKITPKKVGQFVTCWKRNKASQTQAFESIDDIDILIIHCKSGDNQGYFAFPKSVLIHHGILSTATKKGKMGMRVYPSWDKVSNLQAIRSQKWMGEWWIT
jgi:hypothetical protein